MEEKLQAIDKLYKELGDQIDSLKVFLTVNPESGLASKVQEALDDERS